MHHHYTKHFFFDSITDEQEKKLREIDFRYGGDVIAVGDAAICGKFLAISAMSRELLSVLEQEAEKLCLPGFEHALGTDNEGECDDEACVNPEAGKDTKRTN